MRHAGRTVLLTGAAGGLGIPTALAFLSAGATVVAVDNNEDKIAKLREAAQNQDKLTVLRADLSDLDGLRTRLSGVASSTDGFDIVINNAAIYPSKPFEEYSIAEHQAVQKINVDAAIVAVQVALPGMRAKNWGRIINVASITMYGGWALLSPYVASKGALVGLARAWAREFGAYGITVNAIAPGAFPTDAEKIHPDPAGYARFVLEHQAVKRRGTPSDIASALIFLTSDEAGFITGQTLNIDGGWVMHRTREDRSFMGILSDFTVIDCSIAMAGPFAAQRLGDLGANVIKVEPVAGEWQRARAAGGAQGNRINVSFQSLNRNKRSLAIDLKSPDGKAALLKLVATADVFIQNYRPGVAQRLGVDYDSLKAVNPRLVYVSISGYGETGPYVDRPGQDLLLQAMSGAMLSAGREGEPPLPAGQFLADAITAYNAFEGALAALLHRERTGEGQLVQVNMLDAVVTIQMQELSVFTIGKKPQTRSSEPHAHSYIRSPYGVFRTQDSFIVVAFANLAKLGELIGEPSFAAMDDERDSWQQRDEIFARTRERLVTRPASEWLKLFHEHDIWSGPVYGYADLMTDPQIAHNGTFVEFDHPSEGHVKMPGFPIKFSRTPSRIQRGAPQVGEHSREVLLEAGFSSDAIEKLVSSGTVRQD